MHSSARALVRSVVVGLALAGARRRRLGAAEVRQRAHRRHQRRLLPARRRARPDLRQGDAGRQAPASRRPRPRSRTSTCCRPAEGEIAFTLGDSLSDAWKGNEEAGFKTPLDKLRGIAAIYPNYIQIVASADSGIKTLADLKGKRLSVGAPQSGTELNARAILEAAGMTLRGPRQGRVPAVRRVGRADQEPPARRHAAVGRPRRRLDPRPRHVGADHRRRRCRPTSSPRSATPRTWPPSSRPAPTTGRTRTSPTAAVVNFLVTHERRLGRHRLRDDQGAVREPRRSWPPRTRPPRRSSPADALERHAGPAASGRREVLPETGLLK